MLAVASSSVRSAAGSPILEADSDVVLTGYYDDKWLDLPGQPVTVVDAVEIDDVAVTDFRLRSGRLWRLCGWGTDCGPSEVAVTYTHGFTEVPPHVVSLVCDLTVAGMNAAADGVRDPRAITESIDDYSVTFAAGAEAVASVMELPAGTRRWLRKSFGGGAGMVAHR